MSSVYPTIKLPFRYHNWLHCGGGKFMLLPFISHFWSLQMTWKYSNDCKENTYMREQNQELHKLKVGILRTWGFHVGRIIHPRVTGWHGVPERRLPLGLFWLSRFCEELVTTNMKALGENISPQQHLRNSAHFLKLNEALPSLSSSCMNTVLYLKASQQKC